MKIGIPKETIANDPRVAILPEDVERIIAAGHELFVEKDAGREIGIAVEDYERAGATIVPGPARIFDKELVVKLKAPTEKEFGMMKGNRLFCMLHTAQNPHAVELMRENGILGIAMEEVKDDAGGRFVDATDMTGEQGMLYAFSEHGRSPSECNVMFLGYGRVGTAAIRIASQLGASVKILRKADCPNLAYFLRGTDIVVNAMSWPEEKRRNKEYVITKDMLHHMNRGAIVLDLSVDFPGPIETCRPTSLDDPFYFVSVRDEHGTERRIKHICIYGYPGLAPLSCVERYSKQITPLLLEIANGDVGDWPDHLRRAVRPAKDP
ncbi:MAG: hypothetical protein QF415_15340 [Candidatus Undinarchaeales archaeon]|jgi:alanine dehydrogenase|nr:hypothetical protein [Candidatus Undinarchaeales archaeon]MDP7494337.1 hypothetical protein [Candidatus Undinarchaeales archaeon]